MGTSSCESLTSYTARLSEAHSISIQNLFTKIIASSSNNNPRRDVQNKLSKVLNRGAALNSNGKLAEKLALKLTNLTTQKNLYNLTLLSYKDLFSSKKLFKQTKAWCPYCYQEWKESSQIAYEPLLWLFADAKMCLKHHQPLQSTCSSCDRPIPWLAGNSRIGYCSHCGAWLGNIAKTYQETITDLNKIDFPKDTWITKALGDLVAFIPKAKYSIGKHNVSQALKRTIEVTHQGNIAAFARTFQLPKNTVWMWCKGKSKPELREILRICYCLDISVIDFISLNKTAYESIQIYPQRLPRIPKESRRSPKVFDREKTKIYLQAILNDSVNPPINLKEVSEALGFHKRTISNHFPDLCKAITKKYRIYRKLETEKRIQNCCQEIEEIAFDLHQSGGYLTEASISKLLSHPGHLRYKKVRNTLEKAIANVNIQA
ncbi:MAG: TniQ family protein [Cyanobacteria bacterium J06600_6]